MMYQSLSSLNPTHNRITPASSTTISTTRQALSICWDIFVVTIKKKTTTATTTTYAWVSVCLSQKCPHSYFNVIATNIPSPHYPIRHQNCASFSTSPVHAPSCMRQLLNLSPYRSVPVCIPAFLVLLQSSTLSSLCPHILFTYTSHPYTF